MTDHVLSREPSLTKTISYSATTLPQAELTRL